MRILAITPRVLHPANTGGRIRSLRLFEQLAKRHHLTLICLRVQGDSDANVDAMRGCCTTLDTIDWDEAKPFTARFYAELASYVCHPLPYTVLKYRSEAMARRIRERLGKGEHDLLLCDFLQLSINCLDIPFRPKVLFQHNVEVEIRQGLAARAVNPVARIYLTQDAAKLRRYEARAAAAFDHCVMVSEDDCRTMTRLYGVTHVSAVPAAVDSDAFHPISIERVDPTCVFLGSMDMLANQDAVLFFAHHVLPLVRREVRVTFSVVGRNPPPRIAHLATEVADVIVTGTVDDVRPYLARARMLVVPLRIGGGTRIKIFEAMAMAVPVVATRLGAAGLPVTDGRDIVLADTPEEFAAGVVRLVRDARFRAQLGEAGRHLVESDYTWAKAGDQLSRTCEEVLARARSAPRDHGESRRFVPPSPARRSG